jgi:formiminoglutamase
MNIRIFFDIVPEDIYHTDHTNGYVANHIAAYHTTFPDWKNADIAIIGLSETTGTVNADSQGQASNKVRKQLYKLSMSSSLHYKIVDLGNLRCGVNLEESYLRMKEIGEQLLANNTFPIFIGGGHDMDFGQFLSYESSGKMLSLLNVDAKVDMETNPALHANTSHIHRILTHEPNYIFHYCQLAYHSFLCDPDSISILEKLHFETYRIGTIHHRIEEIEPAIRDADLLSFDITAIKSSDAFANLSRQPFGLTAEEACQICWYAGLSSKLTSAGFYEYNPAEDPHDQTAAVIATMIWYVIDGFYHRKYTTNFHNEEFVKYTVAMNSDPHQIIFYKHGRTDKWWIEVPHPTQSEKFTRNAIVPCSYNDYLTAGKGEVPNRWLLAHAKLI